MESYLILNLNSVPRRLDIFAVSESRVDHIEGLEIEETDSEEKDFTAAMKKALSSLNNKWTGSAVIYTPSSYYSCNINLPFNDEKTISRVLGSTVEDMLSFEPDNFIIDHKVVGQLDSGEYDVHLAMAEKQELSQVVAQCNVCGLDPVAISPVTLTPANINNPESTDNVCYLHVTPQLVSLNFHITNQPRADRNFKPAGSSRAEITGEIKRTILAVEKRYRTEINSVCLLSSDTDQQSSGDLLAEIEDSLKAQGKTFSRKQVNPSDAITSVLSGHKGAEDLFVNFRTGELAKVLSIGNIWQIFKPSMPYILLSLLLIIMALFASYYSKEIEIDNLEQSISSKAARILSVPSIPSGQLGKTISGSIQTLEKQLNDIGSPSRYSPLEILVRISKDFSSINLPKLININIKSSELSFTVSSDSFAAIDPIEKILNNNKQFYCSFDRKDTGTGTREFTFTVKLCE